MVLTDLIRRRALIAAFANRDFATRYRSSVLGWGWNNVGQVGNGVTGGGGVVPPALVSGQNLN